MLLGLLVQIQSHQLEVGNENFLINKIINFIFLQSPCDNHYYNNGSNTICAVCDYSCDACVSGTKNGCASCPSGSLRT